MAKYADSHVHHSVAFSTEGLQLFVNALRYYADRLEADLTNFALDPLLAGVLDEASVRSFPVAREIEEVREYATEFEKMIPRASEWGTTETNISHGLVRRLKAIAQLYLSELQLRRDKTAAESRPTLLGLQAVDTRLAQWREKINMGVFAIAEAAHLLVPDPINDEAPSTERRALVSAVPVAAADQVHGSPDAVATPAPVPASADPMPTSVPEATDLPALATPAPTAAARPTSTIEIFDPELRERCADLFSMFAANQQTHRFDTVIAEATRVLEDGVRKRSGLGAELIGMDLMSQAFGPNGKLQLSADENEQSAAHLLFRGTIGFIRNPVQHRLLEQLERERVVQILGYIDYLLYLTANATTR